MRFVKTLLLSGKSIVAALIVAAALLTVMASPAIASPSANEKLLLGLVNDQRAAQGLPLLRFGSRLALAARHHSQDMIDNGYFAHSSPTGETLVDRLKGSGVGGWISAGENLAGAPSPAMAVDLWMNSP
ncbi:MAG: CAP domain-containing protein, partial [Actinomycetota bacterium]|nr:CAP domain-containing protein [Actinomycetota bacterium]